VFTTMFCAANRWRRVSSGDLQRHQFKLLCAWAGARFAPAADPDDRKIDRVLPRTLRSWPLGGATAVVAGWVLGLLVSVLIHSVYTPC
jgi:hypothetical protein